MWIRRLGVISMNLSFDRRGSSVFDIVFLMMVLIVLGLVIFFAKLGYDNITSEVVASGDLGADEVAVLESSNAGFSSWFDYGMGFIFFGLIIGILVTSYFVDSHPVFFVISLILFIFVVFVLANTS